MSQPKRSEVPKEQTWNVESLFASKEAWEQELEALKASSPNLASYSGRLAESGSVLLEALTNRFDLYARAHRASSFASLQSSTEATNTAFSSMESQARMVFAGLGAAGAFFEPELLTLDPEILETFMHNTPGLEIYRHFFDDLQSQKPHIRSSEIESLLAEAGDPLNTPDVAANAATQADMTFEHITHAGSSLSVSHSSIGELLVHDEKSVRKAAWDSYADGHLKFKNTLAATLQGSVKTYAFETRVRNYASSLERSLSQNHIPVPVFENLLETFQANLPTWHRFWALRKKAFGGNLPTHDVPLYDSLAPLVPSPKITFTEACELICKGMAPLGTEYVNPMRRGLLEDRWVDYAQNQGKGSGAYSGGSPGSIPFIFMSWSDDLFAMSTLSHEIGHSMHTYFTGQSQPIVYNQYSLFVAEVASNFNQAMVRAMLLRENTDPRFKLAVLEEAFANFHRYLFVMPTLARLERELYTRLEAGKAISAPWLSERIVELFSEGYGGHVDIDAERLGSGWMNFGHLYAPFYVYQYATGIAAANALAKDVLEQGEPAANRYLNFLKAGSSVYPLEALKIAGIDMNSPEPVERGFAVLKSMVDELETLI
jgi:oligoendopeptidase F